MKLNFSWLASLRKAVRRLWMRRRGLPFPTLPPDEDAPGQSLPHHQPGPRFIAGLYRNEFGARGYKLYVPASFRGQPMPLLVMLHGCTQDPDDFAAGTRMNQVAEEEECFVVYPAQSPEANGARCWNWFSALDQKRGQGEPSIIAGIARLVMDAYPVMPERVYVAGLSAGGAMAAIVGTLYPDVFSAVGVHSGLPFASAQDLPSALGAMRRGAASARDSNYGPQPVIVFHGDRDEVVHPVNGEDVIAQGLRSHPLGRSARYSTLSGQTPGGHEYTHTRHWLKGGTPLGEHWVIHGAGHAWSGGSADGSYTDAKGPDASREMMRFFSTVGARAQSAISSPERTAPVAA
ncbi:PHB depolymerase family esterase [Massilia sp. YIM B04103]|uniref:extracellular catalytic domain type 1 short-chain-length polyhydroxyalkanoate depolymerase n=1 Tax=Massilia sp. YIM B04103 TaxID=2963106 RepID=UPI00210E0AB1|nr:PHB depolymerase family esterase [Massilia sp. YIM B04103]